MVKFAENVSEANCVKSLDPVGTDGVVQRSSVGAPLPEILNSFLKPAFSLVIVTV